MEQINGISFQKDVSRLFAELIAANQIVQTENSVFNNIIYKKLN